MRIDDGRFLPPSLRLCNSAVLDLVRTAATAVGEGGMVVSLIPGHLAAARL
jgi:hypothetical protein